MKNKAGNDVQPLKRFKGFSKKDFLELIKLNHENIEIELPKSTPILKLKETIDSIPLDKFIITGKLKDKMTDNINQHKEYLVKEKTRLQKEKDSSTKDDIRKSLSEKLNEILKCIPVIEKTMKSINATLSDFNNKPFSNMISDDPKIPDNEKINEEVIKQIKNGKFTTKQFKEALDEDPNSFVKKKNATLMAAVAAVAAGGSGYMLSNKTVDSSNVSANIGISPAKMILAPVSSFGSMGLNLLISAVSLVVIDQVDTFILNKQNKKHKKMLETHFPEN